MSFYSKPAAMTGCARHAGRIAVLPHGPAELARVVQGLMLHEHVGPTYGAPIADARRAGSQIRPLHEMLDEILAISDRPLTLARPIGARLVAVCRHFSVMLAGMLRAQGIAARARCGFGAYFEPGRLVDHWVCEYWSADQARWVMVDAQMDAHQRDLFRIDFDPLDVPRDRFIVAGDAWRMCRTGNADPALFGILDMWGLWFIAGNLLRDVAALNNMELLPWDIWGAAPAVNAALDDEQLALFDQLAALTREPDETFAALRKVYARHDGVRVPDQVFNAIRQRQEAVVEA